MRPGSYEEIRQRLEDEVAARRGNMRQLAREIAESDGIGLETVRRALYRILRDGQVPTPETSALLEAGLRKPAGYFTVAKGATRPRQDRLAQLEEEVGDLKEALHTAGLAHAELLRRVEALEEKPVRRARPRAAAATRQGRQPT